MALADPADGGDRVLSLDIGGYGGIGITDKGRALLRGEGAFQYREDTVIVRRQAPVREPARSAAIGRNSPWATTRRRCWAFSRRSGSIWRGNAACRPISCSRTAR